MAVSVSGVVLAAGRAVRFPSGPPKQLLPFAGEPLVRRAVGRAVASRLTEVVVVVGHAAREVRRALAGLEVAVVDNPRFADGQSTSVRTGLAAVAADAAAVLFLTADQPLLTVAVIDRLLATYEATGGPIVVPAYRGRRGSPVLFDRSLFGELARIAGDRGGRQLFSRHPGSIVEVELASAEPLTDVDTPEAYRRLLERHRG